MGILKVKPNSDEWAVERAKYDTASEAGSMMGKNKNNPRNKLLHQKATGTPQEFTQWVKDNLFANGHGVEKLALPYAEKIIGTDLYSMCFVSDEYPNLLATADGYSKKLNVVWECKQWNEEKVSQVLLDRVPEVDYWQCVQLLVVTRADRLLYMVSKDGTPENTVYCWFDLSENETAEDALIRGWAQFNKDRENYVAPDVVVEVIGAQVSELPAINYTINKQTLTLTSNLNVFKEAADKLLAEAKKELHTDQDFADREEMNKKLRNAEQKLKVLREQVIAEIEDVDKFQREISEILETIRQGAIIGEKQVTQRKQVIKGEMRDKASRELGIYIAAANAKIVPAEIPRITSDFDGVMKNKRNLDSIKDVLDTHLAALKIEVDKYEEKITANLAIMRDKVPEELRIVFRDVKDLVLKDSADLLLVINSRIAEFKQAEELRKAAAVAATGGAGAVTEKVAAVVDREVNQGADIASADDKELPAVKIGGTVLDDQGGAYIADSSAPVKSVNFINLIEGVLIAETLAKVTFASNKKLVIEFEALNGDLSDHVWM